MRNIFYRWTGLNHLLLRTQCVSSESVSLLCRLEHGVYELAGVRTSAAAAVTAVRNMASAANTGRPTNRLAQEKSPYLLQHASNPVDWYPWGAEAHEKARRENKPIFLSVGYSTCHWCHVMERESFEDADIGAMMSDKFVCIKVDREERPDIDRMYMTFIQATSGHGGWPMSVWLTPDLKPIVGGTYYPPNDRYFGQPGFKTILQRVSSMWETKKEKLESQGTIILNALMKGTEVRTEADTMPDDDCISKCHTMLTASYDGVLGGFNKQPKFPQPVNFNFLFHVYARDNTTQTGREALEMSVNTLRMMAKGGIHDHVAQGFHRYSTDRQWHVPHFEKMLYDQAQLAASYTAAYQITKKEEFAEVARDILQYVSRDLSHKEGGFYSAEDADSLATADATEKQEGAFCVWTDDEVRRLLSAPVDGATDGITQADVFSKHYGVEKAGNVDPLQDPHDELKGKNVLIVKGSLEETASHFNLEVAPVKQLLQQCCDVLFKERKQRPPPHLDDKMVTSWNGLMISGYARAGQALNDTDYIQRAVLAARFVRTHMYREEGGVLLRSCYHEHGTVTQIAKPIEAFVDDYSFLIRGLLDLYEGCYDEEWLRWAEKLQDTQDGAFWDSEQGAYFTNKEDEAILLRMKDDQDGAEPSSNSVAVSNLVKLASFLDRPDMTDKAQKILQVFGDRLKKIPISLPEMLCGLMMFKDTCKQVVVVGEREQGDTQELLLAAHSHFLPNKALILHEAKPDSLLSARLKVLGNLQKIDGKATAYVCHNNTCSLPVTTPQELEKLLIQY